jgi:NitT/TauT family transport system substrate-binding protein
VPARRFLVALLLAAVTLGGCFGDFRSATPPPSTPLTVGLGYIPSVQFAPFYLADQEGYYRDAGLDVTFQNRIDPDLITLVGQGSVDLGLGDGTSVIPAVSQGIPIRYVATIYGSFPSIVFAKASSGITEPADLAGRRIGIPGRYGSSWVMLQALLGSADLTPDDVQIDEYPDFGQGVAVTEDAVDAATGFINNEPVQLRRTGADVTILAVDDIVPLPGPGLIAGTSTIDSKRDAVQAFVSATIRAMEEIATDPERGLEAAIEAVPELASDREGQLAVLEATIAAWEPRSEGAAMGSIDPDAWERSIGYLGELGLVDDPVGLEDVIDESFTGS